MILKLKGVNKSFGSVPILTDINLTIDEPRFIALIAPNGSGKTTLLNIICNLEKSDSGSICVTGLSNNQVEIFKKTTYMQDNSILYPNLTGLDHIKLVQSLHKIKTERVKEILSELRMESYIKRRVKNYSLGMKQHLLFALALLPKPKLLLMDEPLNGLDPASIVRVRNILKKIYLEGTTIFFSSHNLDQIDKLTTDILFLKNQKLLSYETILTNTLKKEYQLVVDQPDVLISKLNELHLLFERLSKNKYHITCSQVELEEILALSTLRILDVQYNDLDLEKIYFNLYEDYTYDNN